MTQRGGVAFRAMRYLIQCQRALTSGQHLKYQSLSLLLCSTTAADGDQAAEIIDHSGQLYLRQRRCS